MHHPRIITGRIPITSNIILTDRIMDTGTITEIEIITVENTNMVIAITGIAVRFNYAMVIQATGAGN